MDSIGFARLCVFLCHFVGVPYHSGLVVTAQCPHAIEVLVGGFGWLLQRVAVGCWAASCKRNQK